MSTLPSPPEPWRWRTGRKVGRTIYLQYGPEPSDHDDRLIGMMDTELLARDAVDSHNMRLRMLGAV